ncbi:hypothetical protein [Terricaulis silvestris]|uniref:Uncharacterized protein n=1 Tax=Terricaulis silvestris TaxID=2686094 RepID=A0A6I6MNI0_9CAUL|nr:hypothetical protein [Terricaulis silvestris]QGZ95651.1 hypothetical protein DSM104635_02501 [Terricaulis silvestris]
MRLLATTALALILAACNPAPPPAESTDAPVATEAPVDTNAITANGWGPLHVGMTRAEVTAAVGAGNPNAVGGADPASCDLFHPARAPEGMLVMIQQDVLTSIILRNNTELKTDRGFGVGDTSAAIKAAYGASAASEPHKYVDGAEYITIWTVGAPANATTFVQDPAARGVRYETDAQGVVTAVHAGGPSIQNVEGCL